MSSNSLFRIAGIAGILSAAFMAFTAIGSDPSSGIPPALAVVSAVLGITLVAGLYLLFRGVAPALSLAATVISVLGYLLFVAASLMKLTSPARCWSPRTSRSTSWASRCSVGWPTARIRCRAFWLRSVFWPRLPEQAPMSSCGSLVQTLQAWRTSPQS